MVCAKLNFEVFESNHRLELEAHFARTLEILYLKKHCDEKKKNIDKGISIFENILNLHYNKFKQKPAVLECIKLEFDFEINEQNDEFSKFKVFYSFYHFYIINF